MLHRIWKVNRNETSHAVGRENIGENDRVPIRLQLCNTVVLGRADQGDSTTMRFLPWTRCCLP